MQPFDGGVFDKRYDDVFAPGIREAGLEPYRVDRDPGVSIPIDDIETGIRNAELCLAEITTDNPNVRFELGFAIAVPKEVVLVCSEDRKSRFPFDVQHRNIINYKTEAPQDFDELRRKITARIQAIQKKQNEIGRVSTASPLKETEGLSQHEMVALVTVMQNSFISTGGISGWRIREDMNGAGFTDIAISLALKALAQKAMISSDVEYDQNGDAYSVYSTTRQGDEWLIQNQEQLVLKREPSRSSDGENIPF